MLCTMWWLRMNFSAVTVLRFLLTGTYLHNFYYAHKSSQEKMLIKPLIKLETDQSAVYFLG